MPVAAQRHTVRPAVTSRSANLRVMVSIGYSVSKLDVAKEQIAYLKLWLGIVIVTDLSLVDGFLETSGLLSGL